MRENIKPLHQTLNSFNLLTQPLATFLLISSWIQTQSDTPHFTSQKTNASLHLVVYHLWKGASSYFALAFSSCLQPQDQVSLNYSASNLTSSHLCEDLTIQLLFLDCILHCTFTLLMAKTFHDRVLSPVLERPLQYVFYIHKKLLPNKSPSYLPRADYIIGKTPSQLGGHTYFGVATRSFSLPGYTSIPANFFAYADINHLCLPDSITEIGSKAFDNCVLPTVMTPPWRKELIIEKSAFSCASRLQRLHIRVRQHLMIANNAFSGLPHLRTAILEGATISLCEHAFENCKSLTYLSLIAEIGMQMQTESLGDIPKIRTILLQTPPRNLSLEYFDQTTSLETLLLDNITFRTFTKPLHIQETEVWNLGRSHLFSCMSFKAYCLTHMIPTKTQLSASQVSSLVEHDKQQESLDMLFLLEKCLIQINL